MVQEIIEELAWVAAESEVVPWDTFTLRWSETLFADDAHFNEEGTVAYAAHIAGLLASHIRQTERRSRELVGAYGADHGSPIWSATCTPSDP